MNSGTSVKCDASHHAVVVLLGLGAILVLPVARMPLLKLCWQRATSVLPTSLQQRQLRKNHNFGTATRVEIMQCNKGEAAKL